MSDLRQLGMAIMGGLFTSMFVTFLILTGEYKNERMEALENVYFAAEDLEREFSKIIYFLSDEPKELVSNLLGHLSMIFDAKWQNFCVRKIPMPMLV